MGIKLLFLLGVGKTAGDGAEKGTEMGLTNW